VREKGDEKEQAELLTLSVLRSETCCEMLSGSAAQTHGPAKHQQTAASGLDGAPKKRRAAATRRSRKLGQFFLQAPTEHSSNSEQSPRVLLKKKKIKKSLSVESKISLLIKTVLWSKITLA